LRLLGKKGVGVMPISQKLSDFDLPTRSAMNITILFRAIVRMLGSEMSGIVPTLPVGYSVFHMADVEEPFVPAWRPTYSQP